MRLFLTLVLAAAFALMSVQLLRFHREQVAVAEARLLEVDLVDRAGVHFFGLYFGPKEKPIGFAVNMRQPEADGGERMDQMMFVKLRVLGKLQEVQTVGSVYHDSQGRLKKFDYTLQSPAGSFKAVGEVLRPNSINRVMDLTVDGGGEFQQRHRLKLPRNLVFYNEIPEKVVAGHMGGEKVFKFSVFDPASLGMSPLRAQVEGERTLKDGSQGLLVTYTYKGMDMEVLLDTKGNILSEQSPMGFMNRRISADEAKKLSRMKRGLADIVQLTGVKPTGRPIGDARAMITGKYRLSGVPLSGFQGMAGNGQEVDGEVLIVHPAIPGWPKPSDPAELKKWLSGTMLVQVNHPSIARLARRLTRGRQDAGAARKLSDYVYDHLEKVPVVTVPSAVEVLRTRRGDCNEHATLYAALARAAGIPTRVVGGLVFLNGRFLYHAWNEVWVNGTWQSVDSTGAQMPVDATHLRFAEGLDARELSDLSPLFGRIRVEVMKTEYKAGAPWKDAAP